jgi:hypothetical protein
MGVGGSASGSACGPVIVPVFKTGGRQDSCHRWVRLPLASAILQRLSVEHLLFHLPLSASPATLRVLWTLWYECQRASLASAAFAELLPQCPRHRAMICRCASCYAFLTGWWNRAESYGVIWKIMPWPWVPPATVMPNMAPPRPKVIPASGSMPSVPPAKL